MYKAFNWRLQSTYKMKKSEERRQQNKEELKKNIWERQWGWDKNDSLASLLVLNLSELGACSGSFKWKAHGPTQWILDNKAGFSPWGKEMQKEDHFSNAGSRDESDKVKKETRCTLQLRYWKWGSPTTWHPAEAGLARRAAETRDQVLGRRAASLGGKPSVADAKCDSRLNTEMLDQP